MSYESKLDNRAGRIISPGQLCLLLSVALHLLVLKFGLPTIEFNNDSGRREVSVIELNPEQQARLPNLYPQLETPNLPELDDLPDVDLNEPAAPFAIPPSLIPGIGDSANLPPLTIPPPPQFNIPPLPPLTDITLPPVGDLSELPLPPALDPADFKADPIKLPPNIGQIPEPSNKPAIPSAKNPPVKAPTAATKPETKLPEAEAEKQPKPKPKPEPTPEQIAAQKVADSQKRIANLSQSLTKTEDGTTDEDARKNYIAWLAKVRDVEPNNIEIEGTYPRDACIRRLKGSSIFGVVVNAKGEVVALDLIKGAKYPIFNQQGSKDLSELTLGNPTQQPKPYQVTVNYEYDPDICPSLTLPSIRRAEEKQKQDELKQTPAPEVQPETKPDSQAKPESETQPEAKPETEVQSESEAKPESKPETAPQSEPEDQPEPKPEPEAKPEPKPEPSLRDRLRNIPLPNRKPADFKNVPLPERPNFNN